MAQWVERPTEIKLSWCFTSTEARWPIRDGDRAGRGRQSEGSTAETARKRPERPWTAANGSVKAVSPRHCPATCALRNCCLNFCAWTESQRQCPLHRCSRTTWTTQAKEVQLTFLAQLHLPTHDLFWAKLRVQLHRPPLRSLRSFDLAWNPVKLSQAQ